MEVRHACVKCRRRKSAQITHFQCKYNTDQDAADTDNVIEKEVKLEPAEPEPVTSHHAAEAPLEMRPAKLHEHRHLSELIQALVALRMESANGRIS